MRADKALTENSYRSVIHDCGFAPGLSGQFTQLLHMMLPGARRIITYVGGLPQKPLADALYWQRTFSAKGLVELLGPALVLRDGAVREEPSCGSGHRLYFPELNQYRTRFGETVEARITAGAGLTPEIAQTWGLQDCWEETIRWSWEEFLDFIRCIRPDALVQQLEKHLPHTSKETPDVCVMRVVASADDDATASYELCVPYDQSLGISGMAKVTGFSAAAVARMAARGATRPGVMAPEELPSAVNTELIRQLRGDLNIRLVK